MPPTEFCVYNQTRESFLTSRVTVIDAQSEPLRAVKVLIEGLAPDADSGLWLNPLKSIPTVPRLLACDLVYLDREGRVVHGVELAPDDEAPRFDGAASALVLPAHTFAASQTLPGDQVVLRPAGEQLFRAAPVVALASAPAATSPRVESIPARTEPKAVEAITAPFSVFTAIGRMEPFSWPQPSTDPQPIVAPVETPLAASPRSLARFDFLRSIVRLRIRVQISISTAPPASANAHPVALGAPAASAAPLLRPDFSGAASQSGAARSFSASWAAFHSSLSEASRRLARAGAFFATVTLPIFFEHTIPARAAQLRRFVSNSCAVCRFGYLRWADAFMFRPAPADAARIAVRLRFPRWFRA